jgi:hypothetical protein
MNTTTNTAAQSKKTTALVTSKIDEISRLLQFICEINEQDSITIRHRPFQHRRRGDPIASHYHITTESTRDVGEEIIRLMDEVCEARGSKGLLVNFHRIASTRPAVVNDSSITPAEFRKNEAAYFEGQYPTFEVFIRNYLLPVLCGNDEFAETTVGFGDDERFVEMPGTPEISILLNHEPSL